MYSVNDSTHLRRRQNFRLIRIRGCLSDLFQNSLLWVYYLVGVNHFANYGTNRPLIVWETLTMSQNPLFLNDEDNESGFQSPHAYHGHYQKSKLEGHPLPRLCLPTLVDVRFCVASYPVYRMNGRQDDHITTTSLAEVIYIYIVYFAQI